MPVVGNSKFYTEAVDLTTTSDTDIYVVPNNFSARVAHFFISNNNTSTTSYTFKFYHQDDATTHTLLNTYSVNSKGIETIFDDTKPFYMHQGDKLILAAGTANKLVATICVEEFYDPNR